MIVSVDVGFGYVKATAENGKRCCFPSVVTPARGTGELAGIAGGGALKHRVDLLNADNKPRTWLVGEAALAAGGVRTWDTEASRRSGYDTLTLTALALLGAVNRTDVVMGLPLAVWMQKAERKALRERMLGAAAWISVDGNEAHHVEIGSCRIYPQAVGAYFTALANDPTLAGHHVGVLDIGYRTTDCVLCRPTESDISVPDETLSGSFDVGIGQAEDAVVKHLEHEIGGFVEPSIVLHSLHTTGRLSVLGTERDLRPVYEAACRHVAGTIRSHILRLWPDRIVRLLHAVLLAGGGGNALGAYLDLPGTRSFRNPLHANADGFMLMAGQVPSRTA